MEGLSKRLGGASVSFALDRYGDLMPEADADAAAAIVDGVPPALVTWLL